MVVNVPVDLEAAEKNKKHQKKKEKPEEPQDDADGKKKHNKSAGHRGPRQREPDLKAAIIDDL